jgi:hypothetical protein
VECVAIIAILEIFDSVTSVLGDKKRNKIWPNHAVPTESRQYRRVMQSKRLVL